MRRDEVLPHVQPWQLSSARSQRPGSTLPHPATGISQMSAPTLELAPLGSRSDLESNDLQGTIQASFVLPNIRLTVSGFLLQFTLSLRPPQQTRMRNINLVLKFFCKIWHSSKINTITSCNLKQKTILKYIQQNKRKIDKPKNTVRGLQRVDCLCLSPGKENISDTEWRYSKGPNENAQLIYFFFW